jgi:hypothetical protein
LLHVFKLTGPLPKPVWSFLRQPYVLYQSSGVKALLRESCKMAFGKKYRYDV